MLIYQPTHSSTRVVWYGGESTQLHFEEFEALNEEWNDVYVRTLMHGMPPGAKDLLHEMTEFYNSCQCL